MLIPVVILRKAKQDTGEGAATSQKRSISLDISQMLSPRTSSIRTVTKGLGVKSLI